jgi:hypothetical protein
MQNNVDLMFNSDDRTVIYEAARIALSDADIFQHIADEMDASDEHLIQIRNILEKYMNE